MGDRTDRARWQGDDYAREAGHHRDADEWFLDALPPRPGDVVVDLGCGSGEFTARLAARPGAGEVIGVEPDPSMLDAARRHEAPNLRFVQGSARQLADLVDAGSVDLVVSRAMLHWLPLASYPEVFAGVREVLRPGGWYHSESAAAGNVAAVTEVLDDVAARFGLPRLPPFPDPGAVLALVEAAGFDLDGGGVRSVAQRRDFSRERVEGLLRTQASVALTRSAAPDLASSIVDAVVDGVGRTRRWDGTYDQTFVRLDILARRPG